MSAIMQGIGQSQITDESNTSTLYGLNYDSGMRSATGQGGFQLLGLLLSAVFGSAAGAIIGGVASIARGLFGSSSAKKAARRAAREKARLSAKLQKLENRKPN